MAFRTPASGRSFNIPEIRLHTAVSLDFEGDGLGNLGEFVLGTDLVAPDTDRDGVPDGALVRQGTDPLDGLSAATGIIASAPTAGPALDVAAFNNLVVVAERVSGVGVYNVFNGMSPTLVAQVGTGGFARAVAAPLRARPLPGVFTNSAAECSTTCPALSLKPGMMPFSPPSAASAR